MVKKHGKQIKDQETRTSPPSPAAPTRVPKVAVPVAPSAHQRIEWMDYSRGILMFLLFVAHFAETGLAHGAEGALYVYKFLYSWGGSVFFVLAGINAGLRPMPDLEGAFRRFGRRAVAFVFFNFLGLTLFVAQDLITGSPMGWGDYAMGIASLSRGWPSFNMVMWFVACLATTELLGSVIVRRFSGRPLAQLLVSAVCCAIGLTSSYFDKVVTLATGMVYNFWHLHEALVMVGFYVSGVIATNRLCLREKEPVDAHLGLGAILAVATLGTFMLNEGPFNTVRTVANVGPVVVLGASSHGNPFLFLFTAIAGGAAWILLSRAWARSKAGNAVRKPFLFMGRTSLTYLGMAGLVLHFVNEPLAVLVGPWMEKGPAMAYTIIFFESLAMSLLSAPVAWFLHFRAPWLIGMWRRRKA